MCWNGVSGGTMLAGLVGASTNADVDLEFRPELLSQHTPTHKHPLTHPQTHTHTHRHIHNSKNKYDVPTKFQDYQLAIKQTQ